MTLTDRRPLLFALTSLVLVAVMLMWRGHPGALAIPVVIFGAPLFALYVLHRPILILSMFLLVVVNLDFLRIGGEDGISFDIVLSMVLLYGFLVRVLLKPGESQSPGLEFLMVLFLLVAGASVLVSVFPAQSLKRWGRELEYVVIFAFLMRFALTAVHRKQILLAILLSSIFPAVVAILGYFLGIQAFLGQELYIESLVVGEARARGTLSHPTTLALYLMVVGLVTFALVLRPKYFSRAFLVPLFSLQMLAFYLSYARTGWIAFFIAALVVAWMLGYRKWLVLLVPVALFAAWKILPNFQERLLTATATGQENSLLWRFGLWAYSLDIFPRRPVLGSGVGTFIDYVSYQQGFAAHQTWIRLLLETGVIGCATFLGLTLAMGRKLKKAVNGWDGFQVGVFGAWVGMMVGSLGAGTFGLPSVAVYFWVLVALAINPLGKQEPNSETSDETILDLSPGSQV
ncbi:MAG: hypothetical protein HKN21_08075 [Candidatus Eisenbacteria bacterium]|uniref:O-antigen ligase-related domain-containing protein n=1 Tax=Eiseniibacteriota bacterium TaxID=2212470 RepID=A0A7Y2E949_UNCEI|nr:hypothetical protein [Candidatus Eisenbacteria bacterium]